MEFQSLKASIIQILSNASAGRFAVIGSNKRQDATERKGSTKTVQVYYTSGMFSKRSSGFQGPIAHDATFRIELVVASPSRGNLAVLNSEDSTASEFAAALTDFQDASDVADTEIDALSAAVFQIIMSPLNISLGMGGGRVASRWLNELKKGAPSPRGEYVIMSASLDLTCRLSEPITGDIGTPMDDGGVTTEISTNLPGSDSADTAYSAASGENGV